MSGFNDREEAFEKKYAHDEEIAFKVNAKACKLFAQWAAGQLGLTGPNADIYVQEAVAANVQKDGFESVMRKVHDDLAAKGVSISDHMLARQYETNKAEAKNRIMKDTK